MREKVKSKKAKGKTRSRKIGLVFYFLLFTFYLRTAAHEGKPDDFASLIRAWSFDPLIVVGLIVSAFVYFRGVLSLWRSSKTGRGIGRREVLFFAGGWLALVIALVSPLHPWGEVLFSAHMTQHEILMLIAAPLFVLSRPLIAALWALPKRRRSTAKDFLKSKPIEKSWRFLTNPFAAWFIHAVALWIWHVPFLFQATLKSDLVHTLQHASFFLSALLFWYAILASPRGARNFGAGVLYLFTTSIHSGILGAFLTFTTRVWYPAYEKTAASWGLSALEDQQLGGLIMWVPAGIVYIAAGLVMFGGWLNDSEKRVLQREQKIFAESKTAEL